MKYLLLSISIGLNVGLAAALYMVYSTPQPIPEVEPLYINDIPYTITSCRAVNDYVDHPGVTTGIYSGVVDGDPIFMDSYMRYQVLINAVDADGVPCRIAVIMSDPEGIQDGDKIEITGRWMGRGTGWTEEGVGYPLHLFATDKDI